MKIGDIEVGAEYGAMDEPSRHHSGAMPRRVEVVEIVTVQEDYWQGGGFSSRRATRNVRRVKVRTLDEALQTKAYYRDKILTAKRGTTITVEARQLVAPWPELAPAVAARIEAEQKRAARKSEIEAALKAAGFKKLMETYDVRVSVGNLPSVEFRDDKAVDLLLAKLASA